MTDVDVGSPKVAVMAREIGLMGTGTKVATHRGWVGDMAARDALKSCDVVFGCTDDHDGRLFLNRFAHFYGIPVLDTGLRMVAREGASDYAMVGRVTLVAPGTPCLLCRDIVDPAIAAEEALQRSSPEEYEMQASERYVSGANNPAPAVVTFTTETACMAINELLQGLTGFRGGSEGMKTERRRRFDLVEDRSIACLPRSECEICAGDNIRGLADAEPFLHRMG